MSIESYLKILNSIENLFLSNIFKLSTKDLTLDISKKIN